MRGARTHCSRLDKVVMGGRVVPSLVDLCPDTVSKGIRYQLTNNILKTEWVLNQATSKMLHSQPYSSKHASPTSFIWENAGSSIFAFSLLANFRVSAI